MSTTIFKINTAMPESEQIHLEIVRLYEKRGSPCAIKSKVDVTRFNRIQRAIAKLETRLEEALDRES